MAVLRIPRVELDLNKLPRDPTDLTLQVVSVMRKCKCPAAVITEFVNWSKDQTYEQVTERLKAQFTVTGG